MAVMMFDAEFIERADWFLVYALRAGPSKGLPPITLLMTRFRLKFEDATRLFQLTERNCR
jgi:hypothetical protein